MPKKSRAKGATEGGDGGGTKTKKKMSKFDMLKSEIDDEETEETTTVSEEKKSKTKPKKPSGDPGYRPKDDDDDLTVSALNRFGTTETRIGLGRYGEVHGPDLVTELCVSKSLVFDTGAFFRNEPVLCTDHHSVAFRAL